MVERFFAARQAGGGETVMLLSGPPGCGKTSLLFQFAFNCALENSGNVVFICNRRRLEHRPPCLSQALPSSECFISSIPSYCPCFHWSYPPRFMNYVFPYLWLWQGVDPSSDVFQRIQMKYVEDSEGIKKYFAAFHLHETFPKAVIVDDFGNFFDDRTCQDRYGHQRGKDVAMVHTLALCWDAVSQANERLIKPCRLLLCDTHQGESPRLLFIYKRWIPCIFTIKAEGDGGSFTLKKSSTSVDSSGRKRIAKYSVALQYLVLEEITDD